MDPMVAPAWYMLLFPWEMGPSKWHPFKRRRWRDMHCRIYSLECSLGIVNGLDVWQVLPYWLWAHTDDFYASEAW